MLSPDFMFHVIVRFRSELIERNLTNNFAHVCMRDSKMIFKKIKWKRPESHLTGIACINTDLAHI